MMGIDRISTFAVAALAAATLAGAPAAAKKGSDDGAKASSDLAETGVVPGAEGHCRIKFGGSKSRFEVRVEDLVANTEHVLEVDGLAWATFTTDKKGRAKLRFSSRPRGAKELLLPGDPRGGTVSVDNGAADVLAGVCSGEGESSGSTAKLRARLVPTDLAPAGSEAKATFEIRKDGRRKFEVELERVPSGDYAVFVDGTERGTIAVGSLGRGQLEWGDDDGGPPLDFDPRGKLIDVAGSAGILFSGSLDGAIRDAERAEVGRVRRGAPALALVCFNGKTAALSLDVWRDAGYATLALPSSSPAYTRPFAEKLAAWQAIGAFLHAGPEVPR